MIQQASLDNETPMGSISRETKLYQILSGYTRYKGLKICSPSLDIRYEGNIVYQEYLDYARFETYRDEDIYDILIMNGEWSEEDETMLNVTLPKDIVTFQKELYNSAFKSETRNQIRKYLKAARDEMLRLYTIRHKYDSFTNEGVASFVRYKFLVENSTYDSDGKLYKFDKYIPISKVLKHYNETVILPEEIRVISRTHPWVNMWSSAKANGSVFPNSGIEITSQQELLIMWSKMYDGIQESPDCPPKKILDDDDMLDGWLAIQQEKRESDNNQHLADSFSANSRISNAQEVYLIAETVDDAKEIDDMNSARALAVKKSRMNTLTQQGEINHRDFSDVQQQTRIQAANAYNEARKGIK
jgi:hypothetical protein